MITLIIGILVLWFVFRWMFPPVPVVIEPPPPTVAVFTPSIVIHVHLPKGEGN